MSLMRMKDYTYMLTDDGKVPQRSFHILYISLSMQYSLAPNRLATQPIDWVKSIID